MAKKTSWKSGQWNVICDVCGFKKKSGEVKLRWDGLYVCKEDWEPRHSLDFIRAVPDDQSVPFTRPEAEDQFQEPACTSRRSVAGVAIAGCAITGYDTVAIPTGTFDGAL